MASMERPPQSDIPRVVLLLGAPGAGKDTQADRLVEEAGFMPIPSSQIIQKKFAENPDDPEVMRERERYDKGFLVAPELVGKWIMEYVRDALPAGKPLVFSGSPRTVPEGKVELKTLDGLVGLENVVAINLALDESVARERILKRRFCRAHKHPIPGAPEFSHLTKCPIDGSELYVRPLDDPKLLDQRFEEYHTLTAPTIELIRSSGMPFYTIDGSLPILAIHQQIMDILERRKPPEPSA
jgi:adenylate kinase